jgi:pSer/pThr/pTyr-binding forkhead associated (FHA) protein
VYIGRRPDNDIVLRDPDADTRHAVIYWDPNRGRYRINNLSSRGTMVNGRPISMQNLGNGNTIRMGRTELIFRQIREDGKKPK